MTQRFLITGATGFVGGHLAEACVTRGYSVRAIVRPESDVTLLNQLGVTLFRGELNDADILAKALNGVQHVVHAAAKVGDWGPVDDYRAVNVFAFRRLLDACKTRAIERFVHLSSLGVYEARHHYGTTEEEPLPAQHMDGYTQSKVESEQLALSYWRDHKLPVVVLRPGFIYGPRDRTVLPKLIQSLRTGVMKYIARGRYALNCVYVRNLVDAIFLATEKPDVVGKVFNITDGEFVSKRMFIDAVAYGMNLPSPKANVPLWIARIMANTMEKRARKKNKKTAPKLTQARLKFLGLNLDYSIEKARKELGYAPQTPFAEAIEETMAWYRENP
jgi:nucleoside-diphosphate-sugar epimerase